MRPEPGWHRPYLATPWLWQGRDPRGWDCWGMIAWCRPRHYGRPAADHGDLYSGAMPQGREARFALQADLIGAHVDTWSRLDRPRPGAVVLFNIAGRPVHVGLCLGQGLFLHSHKPDGAPPGAPATFIENLSGSMWAQRVEGFYD